jgi:hypothetical protein
MERLFTRFFFQYNFFCLFLLPESLGTPSFRPDGRCLCCTKKSCSFAEKQAEIGLKGNMGEFKTLFSP